MIRVYLAGGTVSGWQHDLMDDDVYVDQDKLADLVEFYNPSDLTVGPMPFPTPEIYSPINRKKIEECDIVFAYLEAGNPTPINTVFEMGYAKGLGKTVIFCNEWTKEKYEAKELRCLATPMDDVYGNWFKPHYLAQVINWVDYHEPDIGIAREILKKLIRYELPQLVPNSR